MKASSNTSLYRAVEHQVFGCARVRVLQLPLPDALRVLRQHAEQLLLRLRLVCRLPRARTVLYRADVDSFAMTATFDDHCQRFELAYSLSQVKTQHISLHSNEYETSWKWKSLA